MSALGIEKRAATEASLRVTLSLICLYGAYGVSLPFLARWLQAERGLDGAAIGAVLSTAQLARIVTGPAIALWADRVADRRTPLRVLGVGAVLTHALFFLWAKDFWALLLIGFIAVTLSQAATPFVEGALLRATSRGAIPYGLARGAGSISFIVANIAGGFVIARFGPGAIAVWVTSGLALYALSVWLGLRPDPAPIGARERGAQGERVRELVNNRRFWVLVASCGLIQASHGFYYSFSTLVWRGQGMQAEQVGFLWAAGVAVEVAFLFALPFLERRFRPEAMILAGGVGGVLRWSVMGFAPLGWVLWPLQGLHAFSFAASHVGAMRLIMREAPEEVQGLAQTIYGGLAAGMLMGLSTLVSGALYDAIGARGYWAMAVSALFGAALALNLRQDKALPGRRARALPNVRN